MRSRRQFMAMAPLAAGLVLGNQALAQPFRRATAKSGAELRIAMMAVTGQQRTALIDTVEAFESANPDLYVRFDQIEHESYKERFEQLAASGQYDVMFWFAGERLAAAVSSGLVLPIDAIPHSQSWRGDFPAALIAATTVADHAYALPISYYNWGFYYPKPLFTRLGLNPPSHWLELTDLAHELMSYKVTPFALGSRFPWTLAGWYDYLNMRLHGIDFHLAQMRGEQTFLGPETREVFAYWADLFKRGWFLRDHAENDWRAVLPPLMRGQAGMVLMGNFIVSQIPVGQVANLGYFPFPTINPTVPRGEDAPTDVMVVPSSVRNIDAAGRFLSYLADPGVQTRFNTPIGQLPPRHGASIPDDPLLRAGVATVRDAAGAAQFFDRDARPAIRDAGLAAFTAFAAKAKALSNSDAAIATAQQALEQGRIAALAPRAPAPL